MDAKDSRISEMIVKDSGISEIGTKDSGSSEIGTKDSGFLEGSSFLSLRTKEEKIRRRKEVEKRRRREELAKTQNQLKEKRKERKRHFKEERKLRKKKIQRKDKIRRCKDKIRRLEDEIRRLKDEIRRLEDEIRRLEVFFNFVQPYQHCSYFVFFNLIQPYQHCFYFDFFESMKEPLRRKERWLWKEQSVTAKDYFISPQWIELGRKLSIPKRELDKSNSKHKKVEKRAFQLLRYWKRNTGRNATETILLDALTTIGLQDVVEYLQEKIQWRHVGWHSHFVFHIGVEKKGRRRKVFHSAQELTMIQEYRYLKNVIRALKVPKALQAKDVPSEKHQRLKKELMEKKMERYKEVVDALWKRNLLLYKVQWTYKKIYKNQQTRRAVKSTNVVAQDDVYITHEDAAANLAQDDEIIAQDESKINSCGLTVNLTKSSKNLTKGIHDVHGIQTLNSREFWSSSSIEAPFRLLSNIEIPHDGNPNGRASCGTITLICLKDGVYSALTCAHVACATDHQQTFLDGERLVSINKAVQTLNKHDENKYMYTPSKSDCKAEIGSSHRHTFAQFDSETDIMSINTGKQEDFKKLIGDEMEVVVLNLGDANLELQRRVEDNKEAVKVRTATGVEGFISELNYEYWCKNSTRRIFQNAIKIKSCQTFLDSGDSGTLVWFLDEKNNWLPFAYGVSEILDDGCDSPENSYICLKLDKALEALGLENGQFFTLRDNVHSSSNSAKSGDGEGGAANKNSKVAMKYRRISYKRRQAADEICRLEDEIRRLEEKKGRRRKAIRALKVPKALQEKDVPLEKQQRLKKELMKRKMEQYKKVQWTHKKIYKNQQTRRGSSNFQEPTLKKSKTDPSMKKDNEIKGLSKETGTEDSGISDKEDCDFEHIEDNIPSKEDFIKKFQTKDWKIKPSVHETLNSFPWIVGDYGTVRSTDEMPYRHLFLEVDQKMKDKSLKQEIDKTFQWNASKYIELRYIEPSDERSVQHK
ncbi:uncharacterized protein LOC124437869 isoform X4 [Xenia sp. Carnegie-2017]|uniref:uncharacterized protein LOC124437869 isoform X4 n=1 Tax=Xenia sp. Carnegie-2017 TaxID=2897299 RepID=UPI001F04FCD4|nr:uncharacterized protein LOC124437869 isoform X4 [Xenia sp. Carnegie-2017]